MNTLQILRNGSLYINETQFDDAGLYSCVLDDGVEQNTLSAALTVLTPGNSRCCAHLLIRRITWFACLSVRLSCTDFYWKIKRGGENKIAVNVLQAKIDQCEYET